VKEGERKEGQKEEKEGKEGKRGETKRVMGRSELCRSGADLYGRWFRFTALDE